MMAYESYISGCQTKEQNICKGPKSKPDNIPSK